MLSQTLTVKQKEMPFTQQSDDWFLFWVLLYPCIIPFSFFGLKPILKFEKTQMDLNSL